MIEIDADLIRQMAVKEKRIDNRGFDEFREIEIETGVVTSAEGSARVRIGETEVVAGVKIDVGEPFPDTQDEGVLMVNTEFVPLASPDFENGPPNENSIEVARVVDRTIRESKALDFKKLCIKAGEKVWMVYVDVDVLDHSGNLIDATCLACVAALLTARFPALKEDGTVNYDKKTEQKLPLTGIPVALTLVKIANRIMVDPNLSEIAALDARLTVGTVDKGGKVILSAMQKGGSKGLTPQEVEKMLDMAMEHSAHLREKLRNIK